MPFFDGVSLKFFIWIIWVACVSDEVLQHANFDLYKDIEVLCVIFLARKFQGQYAMFRLESLTFRDA